MRRAWKNHSKCLLMPRESDESRTEGTSADPQSNVSEPEWLRDEPSHAAASPNPFCIPSQSNWTPGGDTLHTFDLMGRTWWLRSTKG